MKDKTYLVNKTNEKNENNKNSKDNKYSKTNENNEKVKASFHFCKTIKVLIHIFIYMFLILFFVLNTFLYIKILFNKNETPDIFGYKFFVMSSDNSMTPTFKKGDLIIVDKNREINIGDIITYKKDTIITHKVMEKTIVVKDFDKKVKDTKSKKDIKENNKIKQNQETEKHNEKYTEGYITKGLNNVNIDNNIIGKDEVEGVVVFNLKGFGNFITYLQNPLVLVAVILFVLALYLNSKVLENREFVRNNKKEELKEKGKK